MKIIAQLSIALSNVVIKDGKLTKSNGGYTLLNSNNTITQTEGLVTPNYAKDDVVSITVRSNGSIKNDSVFFNLNSKTVEPLIKKFTCREIVRGKIEASRSSTDEVLINFVNGESDDEASQIINNSTTEITLN